MKKIVFFLLAIFGAVTIGIYLRTNGERLIFQPRNPPAEISSPEVSSTTQQIEPEVIAENLKIPWEVGFLPDQSLLVTERTGSLLHLVGSDKKPIPVTGVHHQGEGGLLGLALHPDYAKNNFIYLYLTTKSGSTVTNRVDRYVFNGVTNTLTQQKTIIDNIPGSSNHDGGRIAFGPDGYLYITTGDAQQEENAQDKNSLAGKILRLTDDGAIPTDNPWQNPVYSYGHRNPQGLAWDREGRLWESEHGPSLTQTGNDEINLITKGGNYGWPVIKGVQEKADMITPVIESGKKETWAPGGLAIVDSTLFFTGLRGEALYSATISNDRLVQVKTHLAGKIGRIRTVQLGPDGWLYVTTSNTDGRGKPKMNDDKLVRISPQIAFN